jgi:glyoxylase-like metal-dependent hydrolase (beta-lactamase superfamily II)
MTEPVEIASDVELVADGVWHWRIDNSNIGGNVSSSHAVQFEADDGSAACVLIDPVRLDPHALQQLPPVAAILLTARCHQRAAWRYRRQLGVEVWMPEGVTDPEEEADHYYRAGDALPGGFKAVHTPGPENAHFALWHLERELLVVPDLASHPEGDHGAEVEPRLIDPAFHEHPDQTRASVQRLVRLHPEVLLFDHGVPITDGAEHALIEALAGQVRCRPASRSRGCWRRRAHT